MIQFFRGGGLEGIHLTALRVHPGHHVFDGPVFTGGIHCLKDYQHAELVLSIELVLQFRHASDTLFQQFIGMLSRLDLRRVCGIVVLQAEFFAFIHPVQVGKLIGPTHQNPPGWIWCG